MVVRCYKNRNMTITVVEQTIDLNAPNTTTIYTVSCLVLSIYVLHIAIIAHDSAPEPPFAAELFSKMQIDSRIKSKKRNGFTLDGGRLQS